MVERMKELIDTEIRIMSGHLRRWQLYESVKAVVAAHCQDSNEYDAGIRYVCKKLRI